MTEVQYPGVSNLVHRSGQDWPMECIETGAKKLYKSSEVECSKY